MNQIAQEVISRPDRSGGAVAYRAKNRGTSTLTSVHGGAVPTAYRGARLRKPGSLQPDQTALAQQLARLRRVHGLPRCAQERATFDRAEHIVEELSRLGLDPDTAEVTIDGQQITAREPIQAVQAWCHTCPFKQICLELMTSSPPPYTGIAGGEILHKSRPYRSRIETQRTVG